MRVPEPRRTLPRLAATLLACAAVAVLSVPAAQSAQPAAPTVPTDLYRSQQWTLGALHIPHSWRYSRGNGVTVAVLDTGVDGHQPDLAGRVIDGPDFTGHLRKPGGRYWGRHGTSMASIIAGHGHGVGGAAGVMGVAPDAKILSIRVTWEISDPARTDHSQTDNSRNAIAQGIRYAADHGAQVISMSLGGGKLFYDGNPLEEAAIKYAESKGVVLVASAGNDGNGANRRNYPAAYPGVIAVGAVDRADRPAKFTNRHTYVSVAAPGVEIVSADIAGHGYILGTGTSSSAAFVAGMSALVKARYPALTPAEVKQALEEGASHRPPDGRSTKVGTGVADALGTLVMASHINKAEHAGAAVQAPATNTGSSPQADKGPDLMLIAVLSGGGTLLVLSLILGWRQRRRRPAEEDDPEPPSPPRSRSRARAEAVATRSSGASRTSSTGEGRSPWEPRPAEANDNLSSWEQESSPEFSPWERHSREPSPEVSSWESSQEEPTPWSETSLEMTPWGDPFAEARPKPAPGTPASESRGRDPLSSEPWNGRERPEAPSRASRTTEEPADSSAHELRSLNREQRRDNASWDSHLSSEPPNGEQDPDASWEPRTSDPLTDPWNADESREHGSSWSAEDRPDTERSYDAWSTQRDADELSSETWKTSTGDPLTDPRPPATSWDSADTEASPESSWRSRDASSETNDPREPWSPSAETSDENDPLFGPRPADLPEPRADEPAPDAWDSRRPGASSDTWSQDETPPERPWEPATEAFPRVDEPVDRPRDRARHRKDPAPTDPHESPDRTYDTPPAESQDVRVAGGIDPLSDAPIDSSSDVGTPLADESWESIRRSFDRLKEDARNWESIAKDDTSESERESAQDAYDETINMPAVSPDDEPPPHK